MALGLGEILVKLGLDNSGLQQGLKDSKKEIGGLNLDLKKLATSIGVAFGTKEVVQFAAKSFDLAERFETVRQAFDRTGASLSELRSATGGAVSDFSLLQNTVRAANFGIPVERLASAFEFATIRAAETGESVQFLVDSIVTGIGRKSALVLDNLGISAVAIQEEFKKTGDFAQAAFNLIEREAGKSSLSVNDAATSAQKLAASFENLQLAIGQLLTQGGLVSSFVDSLVANLKLLSQTLNNVDLFDFIPINFVGQLIQSSDELAKINAESAKAAGFQRDRKQAVDTYNDYIDALKKSKGGLIDVNAETQKYIQNLRTWADQAIINLDTDLADYYLKQAAAVEEAARKQKALNELEAAQLNTLGGLRTKLEELNTEFESTDVGTAKFFQLGAEITRTKQKIDDLVTAATTLTKTFQSIPNIGALSSQSLFTPSLPNMLDNAIAEGNVRTGQEGELLPVSQIQDETAKIQLSLTSLSGLFENIGNPAFSFGESILNGLSGFMSSFGRQLVALGLAKIALDKLFAVPGGGAIAIAAGTALIAAANALKGQGARAVQSISSGGGSRPITGANVGGFSNNFDQEPPVFKVYVGPHELMTAYDYSANVVGRTTGRRG